jgi:hypothetical protein
MTQEQLRMQMLAGIITEGQYKAILNENTLSNYYSNADKLVKNLAKELDNLIGDHPEKETIVDKIIDLADEYYNERSESY